MGGMPAIYRTSFLSFAEDCRNLLRAAQHLALRLTEKRRTANMQIGAPVDMPRAGDYRFPEAANNKPELRG
jgi:hypothetical protein